MTSGQLAKAIPLAAAMRAYFETHPRPGGDEFAARAYGLSAYLQLILLGKPNPDSDAWLARAQAELALLDKKTAAATRAEIDTFRATSLIRGGRMEEGQALALAAYATQEKISGPESELTLTALQILGTAYLLNGQYREAQPYARQLVERLKKKRPDSVAAAIACNNLAAIHVALGQPQRARPLLEQTVTLLASHLGPDSPNVAMVRSNLALLLKDEGDYAAAVPIYAQARESLSRSTPPGHPHRTTLLTNYAFVLAETGRTAEAIALHQEAAAEIEKNSGPTGLSLAGSFIFQTRAYLLAGKPREALAVNDRAAAALPKGNYPLDLVYDLHKYRLQSLLSLGESELARKEAAVLQETRYALLAQQLSFTSESERLSSLRSIPPFDAVASTGDAEMIATAALRLKGLVIEAMLEDESLAHRSQDPEIARLLARLRQKNSTLDETERQSLEQQLARSVANLEGSRRALKADVRTVAQSLAGNEALIEYIAYRQWQPDGSAEPSFGAIVLQTGLAPRWLALGRAEPIEQALAHYEQYVRDGGSDRWPGELRRLIIDPVLAILPATTGKLFISPDAGLHTVSFASLPMPDGKFLAEKYIVASVNSGRDLLSGPAQTFSSREAIGLANPAFAESSRLPPLPNSVVEVETLLKTAGKEFSTRLLTGTDATAANLQRVKSPYILHLATHGFAADADDASGLQPIQSYLALAGTDRLTAADAATLNLEATWLTTLATCDSGRGAVAVGEGLLGLRRGFLRAGTRHLALALWRLPDDVTTRNLLTDFYTGVFSGLPPEDALASAQGRQLRMLADREGLGPAIRKAGSMMIVVRK